MFWTKDDDSNGMNAVTRLFCKCMRNTSPTKIYTVKDNSFASIHTLMIIAINSRSLYLSVSNTIHSISNKSKSIFHFHILLHIRFFHFQSVRESSTVCPEYETIPVVCWFCSRHCLSLKWRKKIKVRSQKNSK